MAHPLPVQQPATAESVQAIGMRLLDAMGDTPPGLFDVDSWKGRIAARAMENDAFRVALFRFVDVLPQIADDARLVDLAREHFEPVAESVSPAMATGMRLLGRGGPFKHVAARIIRGQAASLGSQFIVGGDIDDALPGLAGLWREGCAFSVDLLGEVTHSEPEAAAYRARYIELLDTLEQATGDWPDGPSDRTVNVSVKLSALDPLLDPMAWDDSLERAVAGLHPIFQKASAIGAHVHVDMEHYDLKDLTLAAVYALLAEPEFADGPSTGVVLQAYLKETEADLNRLLDWCGETGRKLHVRLVKGEVPPEIRIP